MGKNDKGSKDTGYNKGLSDTIQVKSSSTQKLERDPIEQNSKGTNIYGNVRNVEEGSNKNLSSFANSVSKQSLLSSQEGRGSQSSHKFERIKQKHTLPALQNVGLALSKVHVATGRLHVQARHERRLFLSPPKQNLKGKTSFLVVWEAIRVPLPLFRPESCTKIFIKILKVPMSLLRRFNIRIIIYLDDMLLLGKTMEEILVARDTLIFLLQHLWFVINLKKSVLEPQQKMEFLGLIIDFQNLSLSLTEQKLQKVKNCCMEMYKATKVSILELKKLLGLLCSTVQAVLPAQLQLRYLQQLQIRILQQERCCYQQITLNQKSKQELTWWIQNLSLCNGRCLVQPPPQMIIQTNASKTGWGVACQREKTRGVWSEQEQKLHINILELLAVKLALLSFTKNKTGKDGLFRIDAMSKSFFSN